MGEEYGAIEKYYNRFHNTNCYLKLHITDYERLEEADIFSAIYNDEKAPLQVMLSSEETEAVRFLEAKGFVKRRSSYELTLTERDLLEPVSGEIPELAEIDEKDDTYVSCCRLLFDYYKETHRAINPLTASFSQFMELLPHKVYYLERNNKLQGAAFVEKNELAYICPADRESFREFALAVLTRLFAAYEAVAFEADDTDWAAMAVKALFRANDGRSVDTYIFASQEGH